MRTTYVILSGGRSSRLGSDKASTVVNGVRLLELLLMKLPSDSPKIVVGDQLDGISALTWVREAPAFGGPVAALAAAITLVESEYLAVLAVDMPFAPEILQRLDISSLEDEDALIPFDSAEFAQPLCAIYRKDALENALAQMAPVAGKSMRELLSNLNYRAIRLSAESNAMLIDIDTPNDLEKVRNGRVD